jgi:hypothetical protein
MREEVEIEMKLLRDFYNRSKRIVKLKEILSNISNGG